MEECGGAKSFPAGWSLAAKPCTSCKSAAAMLFCRVESAFMCMKCEAEIHSAANKPADSRHERVWMCEVCEQAPTAITCKGDAAALCVTCDRDIHSVNPLARRHERCPVVPFYDTADSVFKSAATAAAAAFLAPATDGFSTAGDQDNKMVGRIHSIPITAKFSDDTLDMKSIEFLFSDSNHITDLEQFRPHHNSGTDGVVPVQTFNHPVPAQSIDHLPGNRFGSNLNSYNNSRSVSSSSIDVGVVPDGSTMSEISFPFARNLNNGADLRYREARVLRYREKKKSRKFEKTIRYASRKAYAEKRPRIKGRFAKRTEVDADVDRMFTSGSPAFMAEAVYGVVPSF